MLGAPIGVARVPSDLETRRLVRSDVILRVQVAPVVTGMPVPARIAMRVRTLIGGTAPSVAQATRRAVRVVTVTHVRIAVTERSVRVVTVTRVRTAVVLVRVVRVAMAAPVRIAVTERSVRVVTVTRVRTAVVLERVVLVAMVTRVRTAVGETAVPVVTVTPARTAVTERSVRAVRGMRVRTAPAPRARIVVLPVIAGPVPGLRAASTARTLGPRVLRRTSVSAGRRFPKR